MKVFLLPTGEKRSTALGNSFFGAPDRYYQTVLFFVISVLPLYIFSVGRLGWKPLILLLIIGISGLLSELTGSLIIRKKIYYFGVINWLIYPLLMPPGIPVWIAVIGFLFGQLVCVLLFGGFGTHFIHPAVVGQVFLLINFAQKYNSSLLKPFRNGSIGFMAFSSQTFMKKSTLLLLQDSKEIALEKLFFGPNVGVIGETFPFLILICGLFYLILGDTNVRTPLSFLLSLSFFSFLGNRFISTDILSAGYSLLSGGILFFAFFIFSDPWSSAKTRGGRISAGVIAAALTIIIRTYTSNVEGVMFAALFNYCFSPLYDELIMKHRKQKKVSQ